ncbi:EAL domain-containing protein (putative c-di-GMP-specific phosphodiesterase class I) [Orenia metallireducens]|jgi:EAL domain-containing protein (putative c-di-GMP-specific phosphodiesterase class I)|uniref:EAL domain, c-di-GMP-specific phosphodiesterase class I (Or its enzymatically inactive variant) n=1 Tax=Orenia metallireducens TaxID=1413210 RepID=A0A285HP46_9FIRM|nr:EAL domain-containing protein [Orenia metallireducens]PRX27976.1 EAL domain-containing protein (putative c-di-GMP-specific phosphodiesterase class I) [Orenia metallireducens]SNY37505.1 EAL domain, c-di-GMP-specific phosphodiesterase class I (or its enzymatically inactive variant) [Orenia metallireducens]
MKKYQMIFCLDNLDQIRDIFGDNIIVNIKNNIDKKFKEIVLQLLERHSILSEKVEVFDGCWSLIFAMEGDNILVDIDEQLESIQVAGSKLIRELLREEFGDATGNQVSFKFLITPLDEDANEIDSFEIDSFNYINYLLEREAVSDFKYNNIISKGDFVDIIKEKKITTFLQAIISLKKDDIIGYEVLTRGPLDSGLFQASDLFSAAAYFDLTEELELAAIIKGLEWGFSLPDKYMLFLNIGPKLLLKDTFYDAISDVRFAKLLSRVVFEITEHMPLSQLKQIKHNILKLNKLGANIALDDTGCGFYDMAAVEELRPKIVKLCITVAKQIGADIKVEDDIYDTVVRIKEAGSIVLAEGIENKEQLDLLKRCNVDLVQGYYYHRPKPAAEVLKEIMVKV